MTTSVNAKYYCYYKLIVLLALTGYLLTVSATHIAGLSAVTVQDQPSPISHHTRYYFRQLNIKNWVTPTNQSLFINGKLKDNSMFLVSTSGIYYVAANIRIKVNKERYGWYYWSTRISGKVYLVNLHGRYTNDPNVVCCIGSVEIQN